MGKTVEDGGVSFWFGQTGAPASREPLPGDSRADVCIVGGGYTGLWTAHYLKRAAPFLRIIVLERRYCGYGASGRNGGWLYNGISGRDRYAKLHGHRAAVALQQAMNDTVDEVIGFCAEEEIDADVVKGGVLEVAYCPAQLARLTAYHETEAAFGDQERLLLSAGETADRVKVAGGMGGTWTPHGARIHPLKLLQGLARAVESAGVVVHESTEVTEIRPNYAVTAHGSVRAPYIVRCTEGFTAGIKGLRRTWVPLNSSMIVTEPLPDQVWEEIGWSGREVLGDMAHAYVYAQRTADDRIALGGRGIPYRYGSRPDDDGHTAASTVQALRTMLKRLFPAAGQAAIARSWSGVLAVPRDWCASVGLDPASGLGWAGGYVGSGVAAANLAARTLCDLVRLHSGQGGKTELTELAWVGHQGRRWEPEPLRWMAIQGVYAAYRHADRQELAGRPHTAPLARAANRVSGRV